MDVSAGTFTGTLDQLNIGVFSNSGAGGGKGSLICKTGGRPDIFLAGDLLLNAVSGGTSLVERFTWIENLGTSGVVGHFDGFGEGALMTLNFGSVSGVYQLSYAGGISGRDVVLAQIPEPTRWWLMMAGALGFMMRRRR